MKIENLKLKSLSLGVAATLAMAPIGASATSRDFKIVYNQETQEDELYYIVQEGDTASQISVYLINYFMRKGEVPKEDRELYETYPNAKCAHWVGFVYHYIKTKRAEGKNVTRYRGHPGVKVPVPRTYQELVNDTATSIKSGFHARYCQNNGIYPVQQKYYIDPEDAYKMIEEEFRTLSPDRNVEITPEIMKAVLELKSGPEIKFVLKEGAKPKEKDKWKEHMTVISPEEAEEKVEETKQKQKVKKKTNK